MALNHGLRWQYERRADRPFPLLTLTITGVHDVGRIIATLARGNCEHGELARMVGRDLNRTEDGRATLAYLERAGGPKLAPNPCEQCEDGNHVACFQIDDPYEEVCGCFEADPSLHPQPADSLANVAAPSPYTEGGEGQ